MESTTENRADRIMTTIYYKLFPHNVKYPHYISKQIALSMLEEFRDSIDEVEYSRLENQIKEM